MTEHSLKAIIFAAVKHARLQTRRQLATHFGLANAGRHVEDDFSSDLAGPEMTDATEPGNIEQSRQRQIVTRQIREFTSEPHYVELIERRLFLGEPIVSLATELGINPATARSIVMRARQYLCLTD